MDDQLIENSIQAITMDDHKYWSHVEVTQMQSMNVTSSICDEIGGGGGVLL